MTKPQRFEGKKWVYRSLEYGTRYTAVKISNTALPLTLAKPAPRPPQP